MSSNIILINKFKDEGIDTLNNFQLLYLVEMLCLQFQNKKQNVNFIKELKNYYTQKKNLEQIVEIAKKFLINLQDVLRNLIINNNNKSLIFIGHNEIVPVTYCNDSFLLFSNKDFENTFNKKFRYIYNLYTPKKLIYNNNFSLISAINLMLNYTCPFINIKATAIIDINNNNIFQEIPLILILNCFKKFLVQYIINNTKLIKRINKNQMNTYNLSKDELVSEKFCNMLLFIGHQLCYYTNIKYGHLELAEKIQIDICSNLSIYYRSKNKLEQTNTFNSIFIWSKHLRNCNNHNNIRYHGDLVSSFFIEQNFSALLELIKLKEFPFLCKNNLLTINRSHNDKQLFWWWDNDYISHLTDANINECFENYASNKKITMDNIILDNGIDNQELAHKSHFNIYWDVLFLNKQSSLINSDITFDNIFFNFIIFDLYYFLGCDFYVNGYMEKIKEGFIFFEEILEHKKSNNNQSIFSKKNIINSEIKYILKITQII